jgi:hypothetical protein
LRPRDGSGGSRAQLFIDARAVTANIHERLLRRVGGQIGSARQKLDQLAPAHSPIVRIARGLRQHSMEAIVEPHALLQIL